ncbi:MAG: hypothetical protein ACK4WH_04305 [Phycisphaerales bacterium]
MTTTFPHSPGPRPAARPAHLAAVALGLLLTACQSTPDISAWNKATADVASSVSEGFHAAAGVNGSIATRLETAERDPDDMIYRQVVDRYRAVADALNARAEDYEQVFGAIADYSASLAAIARAADNSQQTVEAVAGSLNTLVESVGGTRLAGAGFELGKALANEVIKVKAARDFAEAVEKADPAIESLAGLLDKDLEDLAKTVGVTKVEAIRAAVTTPYQKNIEYRNALLQRRNDLQAAIEQAVWPRPNTPDAPRPPTNSTLNIAETSELANVERYLREADSWYAPMSRELDRALEARAIAEQLAIQTRRAVGAWRDAHASLAAATRERRLPESGRLAALAVRIRDLAAELKENKER